MGYTEEYGWVDDEEPTPQTKPALWVRTSVVPSPLKHELSKLEMSRGGVKGGPARASKLSPERRREIALKAAQTRWGRKLQSIAKEGQ